MPDDSSSSFVSTANAKTNGLLNNSTEANMLDRKTGKCISNKRVNDSFKTAFMQIK